MRWMFQIAVIVLAIGSSAALGQDKQALPSADAIREATELVQSLYAGDVAKAKTTVQKAALAKRLAQLAAGTSDDPAGRYVLLVEARKLAAEICDLKLTMDLVDRQCSHFELDVLEAKSAALRELSTSAKTPAQYSAVANLGIEILNTSLAEDRYEFAHELAKDVSTIARKARNIELISEVKKHADRIDTAQQAYAQVKLAQATLAKTPADPEANLVLGKYLCFRKGDWKQGLPCLAQSSDAKLKALAASDLKQPTAEAEQVKLGDAWFDLAEQHTGLQRDHLRWRAAHWYQPAVRKLSGFSKRKVEKRLGEIQATPAPSDVTPTVASNTKRDVISRRQAVEIVGQLQKGIFTNEAYDRLGGKEIAVPANPRNVAKTGIAIENGQIVLLVPCPGDRWNTSPARWKDVDFRGHRRTNERAGGGLYYMQLCFYLNDGRLTPVESSFVVQQPGKLGLAPSDRAGGGNAGNNRGSVRVKVIRIGP